MNAWNIPYCTFKLQWQYSNLSTTEYANEQVEVLNNNVGILPKTYNHAKHFANCIQYQSRAYKLFTN